MDKIIITGLEISAIIGVLPEERMHSQLLVLDMVLFMDLEQAGKSDDIGQTVDYGEVADEIRSCIEKGRFQLIESAARAAAFRCLQFDAVREVTVTVKKPGALSGSAIASCEFHRVKE